MQYNVQNVDGFGLMCIPFNVYFVIIERNLKDNRSILKGWQNKESLLNMEVKVLKKRLRRRKILVKPGPVLMRHQEAMIKEDSRTCSVKPPNPFGITTKKEA